MTSQSGRIQNEIAFHTSVAAKEMNDLTATPDTLVERYRECRQWRTRRLECVIRFLTQHQPKRICDFGCGSGEMACRLGRIGFSVTGLDVSPELIEVARHRARLDGVEDRVNFVVADGGARDLSVGKFDAVLAMSVLHHLPLEDGLATLESLLLPGGRVAIHEPVAYSKGLQWLRDRTPVRKDISPDERQLSAAEILRIQERFEVEDIRHFHLFARLSRVFPPTLWSWIAPGVFGLDSVLLGLPWFRKLAGIVVIQAKKRE